MNGELRSEGQAMWTLLGSILGQVPSLLNRNNLTPPSLHHITIKCHCKCSTKNVYGGEKKVHQSHTVRQCENPAVYKILSFSTH